MTYKITVCGPRDRLPSHAEDHAENFAEVLHSAFSRGIYQEGFVLATGGVMGFPSILARAVRERSLKYGLNIPIHTYTPAVNESEWDEYQKKGLFPERELFDQIHWSPDEGDLVYRALRRIPLFLKGSSKNICYLDGPGNTHLEVLSSISLNIPTLCFTDFNRGSEEYKNSYNELVKDRANIQIYRCLEEVIVQEFGHNSLGLLG